MFSNSLQVERLLEGLIENDVPGAALLDQEELGRLGRVLCFLACLVAVFVNDCDRALRYGYGSLVSI